MTALGSLSLAVPDTRISETRRVTTVVAPATLPPEQDWEREIVNAFARYVDAGTTLPRYVARNPLAAVRVMRAIAALPAFVAELPDTTEGLALRDQLLRHRVSRRAMLGVSAALEVPTSPGSYAEGHAKATVRRKVRAAERQGITVRRVGREERVELLRRANTHEQENARVEYRVHHPDNTDLLDIDLWLAAYDAAGSPIMLAVTPIAGEWAGLRYFRTLAPGSASSDARYLVASELAETLGQLGVRWLVDSARPHWLPNGLRHFQRMLGFRLIRIPAVHLGER